MGLLLRAQTDDRLVEILTDNGDLPLGVHGQDLARKADWSAKSEDAHGAPLRVSNHVALGRKSFPSFTEQRMGII